MSACSRLARNIRWFWRKVRYRRTPMAASDPPASATASPFIGFVRRLPYISTPNASTPKASGATMVFVPTAARGCTESPRPRPRGHR